MGTYRKLQHRGLVFLTLLVLTACSGTTPPTAVPFAVLSTAMPAPTVEVASTTGPDPAATAGTEEALLARAQEAHQAWGNWLAIYKYNSPRYRETCKSGDYVVKVGSAMLLLHTFMGIPEDAKIEVRLDKVVITVESEGRVHSSLLVDGELLEFSEDENTGERWVFLDGQWWAEPEDWREACPGLSASTEPKTTSSSPPVPLSTPTPTPTPIPTDTATLRPVPTPIPIQGFEGTGQQVSAQFELFEGASLFTMTHDGSGVFAVQLLDEGGQLVDLLANKIGRFEGSKAVGAKEGGLLGAQPGTHILNITADGNWTVSIEQ